MLVKNREDETQRMTRAIFDNLAAICSNRVRLREIRGDVRVLEAEIKAKQLAYYRNLDTISSLEASLHGLEQRVSISVQPEFFSSLDSSANRRSHGATHSVLLPRWVSSIYS